MKGRFPCNTRFRWGARSSPRNVFIVSLNLALNTLNSRLYFDIQFDSEALDRDGIPVVNQGVIHTIAPHVTVPRRWRGTSPPRMTQSSLHLPFEGGIRNTTGQLASDVVSKGGAGASTRVVQ